MLSWGWPDRLCRERPGLEHLCRLLTPSLCSHSPETFPSPSFFCSPLCSPVPRASFSRHSPCQWRGGSCHRQSWALKSPTLEPFYPGPGGSPWVRLSLGMQSSHFHNLGWVTPHIPSALDPESPHIRPRGIPEARDCYTCASQVCCQSAIPPPCVHS